jgi:hypothetical protein
MIHDPFPGLPDETRLWVIVLDHPLESTERERFEAGIRMVLEGWRHKGQAYEASWHFQDAQLLLVAEPLLAQEPSGCAIDGMLRKVERVAVDSGARLATDQEVVIRCGRKLELHCRTKLPCLLAEGHIDSDTILLDRSLHVLSQLRQGCLERPLVRTWIGRKYGLAAMQG